MPNFKVEIKRNVGGLLQVASVIIVAKNPKAAGDKAVARADDGGYEGVFTPSLDAPIGDQDFNVEVVNVEKTDDAPTPYRDPSDDEAGPDAGTAGAGTSAGSAADAAGQSQLPVDATNTGPVDPNAPNPPDSGGAVTGDAPAVAESGVQDGTGAMAAGPQAGAPGTNGPMARTVEDATTHVMVGTDDGPKLAPIDSPQAQARMQGKPDDAPAPRATSDASLASAPGTGTVKAALNNAQQTRGDGGRILDVNSGAEVAQDTGAQPQGAADVAVDQGAAPASAGTASTS